MDWNDITKKIYNVQNDDFPFADYMKLNAERILERRSCGAYSVTGIGCFSNLKAFLRDNDDGSQEYRAWVEEFIRMLKKEALYLHSELETL